MFRTLTRLREAKVPPLLFLKKTHPESSPSYFLNAFKFNRIPPVKITYQDQKLKLTISNPSQMNALSINILEEINNHITSEAFKKSGIKNISIQFDTRASTCSCAGYNLQDFDLDEISTGIDPMPANHPACQVIDNLYALSKSHTLELVADKHLLGFGIVIAGFCHQIRWGNDPKKIILFLPHFRMGVAFPLLPMLGVIHKFGADLTTQFLIANIALPAQYIDSEIQKTAQLTQSEKEESLNKGISLITQVGNGKAVEMLGEKWEVADRTQNLKKLSELHCLQFEVYRKYGINYSSIPRSVINQLEALRVATITPGLAQSIGRHRDNPRELSPHIHSDKCKIKF